MLNVFRIICIIGFAICLLGVIAEGSKKEMPYGLIAGAATTGVLFLVSFALK